MVIIDDKVYMYRGDDETLQVDISDDFGEPFVVGESEIVTLTVREYPNEESDIVFATSSVPGSNRIIIRHEDTMNATPGKYSADIQLLTAEGKRKTVWPVIDKDSPPDNSAQNKNRKNFILLPEVTID